MCSKGNYKQGEKITLRMGENNSKWNNWQRINFQNIQAAHATQYQKKQPNQKVGKRPKQTFLQRRYTRWLINTWKDAQHHSLSEKCKSKPRGTITRQPGWLLSKSLQAINAERVWRKGNPLTLLVGMQTSTATMENSVEIP